MLRASKKEISPEEPKEQNEDLSSMPGRKRKHGDGKRKHTESSPCPEAKGHTSKKARSSAAAHDGLSSAGKFNFYLSKVQGISAKYNSAYATDIKDILAMGDLEKSAQFSYVFDIPWLVRQYPPEARNRPLTIVHGFQRKERQAIENEGKPYPHLKFCRAKLDIPYGTHHTKMMLLLYSDGMRVVITTANLIPTDWAQKTQGLWVSPLYPKLPSESETKGESPTNFKKDLLLYLNMYKQPEMEEWISAIKHHDLSATRVYLVASAPGRHMGDRKAAFGHLKLRKLLEKEGPKDDDVNGWPVIAQFSSFSSMGAGPEAWMGAEFLSSLSATVGLSKHRKPDLKLIYPSVDNVRKSLEGYPAGASLPYSIKTAQKQQWVHKYLHHWYAEVRGRSEASPHIKTFLRASPDWRHLAWFLVTSSNLSKAAWGVLEKQGSQLMIRSYELGVLFLPKSFDMNLFEALRSDTDDREADHVFHVPYDLPPTIYNTKTDRPWIWDIPQVKAPDRFGNKWCPPV